MVYSAANFERSFHRVSNRFCCVGKITFLPDKVYSLIWFTRTIHFFSLNLHSHDAPAESRQNQSASRLVFFVSVTEGERGNERERRETKKKGNNATMWRGAEDGTKGMKGNTWPDRRVRKVQWAEQAADTVIRYRRKKDEDIGIWARKGQSGATWRRERKQEENQVGARRATLGYNREEDGDVEQVAKKRQESVMRDEVNKERRPSRVSEKSRAIPRGAEREKDFPEVETYIFREANETAQCGGMDSPSSSDPVWSLSRLRRRRSGMVGRAGIRRWLAGVERCENSVAHEHPPTDEHGLLYVEQRECRACDVPLRSLPRGSDCGSQQSR